MTSLKGKPLSQSHKEKIAITQRQRLLPNPMSEETRQKLSLNRKGRIKSIEHKQKIAVSQKERIANIRQCSACSVRSKWIYTVRMPFTEYPLLLCNTDLIEQFHSLSPEDKQRVQILQ